MVIICESLKKYIFSVLLCVIVLSFSSASVLAAEIYTGDFVNFRKEPSLDAEKICVLPVGETVLEKDRLSGGWSMVAYNAQTGYIKSEFLTSVFTERFAYAVDNLNFRKNPSLDAYIIATIPTATMVLELEKLPGGWSKVMYNAQTGYMKSEFLTAVPPEREVFTLDKVNLRKTPSLDAKVLDVLSPGIAVTECEKLSSGFSRVKYGGAEGYIFNEYLGTQQVYQKSFALSKSAASAGAKPKSETARSAVYVPISEISASGIELLDWQTVKGFFPMHTDCLVTDVWTGKQYYIRCFSKGNHADVEPASKSDTETMLAAYGGVWSWDTRPVWVTVGGRTLAASINGMPHGGGVVSDNGMNGQVCLHFRGSRTHNGNVSHENAHQASVTAAWNAANK